jgi:hypothetical protein
MERIITYDVKEGHDYKPLYDVLEKLNGKMLTESTYLISTELSQSDIIQMIKEATYSDDNIYYISVGSKDHLLFADKI